MVEDADEPPVFSSPTYLLEVHENAALNSVIGQVTARDPDVTSSPIRYFFFFKGVLAMSNDKQISVKWEYVYISCGCLWECAHMTEELRLTQFMCVCMHKCASCTNGRTRTCTPTNSYNQCPEPGISRWITLFQLSESSRKMQNHMHFAVHLGGSFIWYGGFFCLFVHLLFSSIVQVLLAYLLSPLIVTVNYT